jgi:NADH-quinone oxidoreductase subunit L
LASLAVSSAASLAGVALAYLLYVRRPQAAAAIARRADLLRRLWLAGWGFDWLYDRLLVRPFVWIAAVNRDDAVDSFFDGIAWTARAMHRAMSLTQTGRLRWYAAAIALAAVIALGIVVLS